MTRPEMRRIGILGGMSWESTAEYYRLANESVKARLGGLHSADLALVSVDFAPIEELQIAGAWEELGAMLAAEAQRLEQAGAGIVVLATNTMHKVAPAIETAIGIPLLHIADAAAAAAKAAGIRIVGLLGTAYTMEQEFYRDRLAANGLTVLIPDVDDRDLVHRVIFEELVRGIVRDDSRAAFEVIISRLVAAGAQGIVLGCTEIELLLDPDEPSQVPLFPTTRLHVEAAVNWALAE